MDILSILVIICLLGSLISMSIFFIAYDNKVISNIAGGFGISSLIILGVVCLLFNNRPIDKTNLHCLNMKLIDGSSTTECFNLSDKQMKKLNIYFDKGSYWLITSENNHSIFIKYQKKLKPAVIDFHIIK
jgi:hypothetical protein